MMGIKFEGEPPFDLGLAQTASAQVLESTVVLRVTLSVPNVRPKPVPVRVTMTADVANTLLDHLATAVRTAELHKRRKGR
jgi:hypothetical protein